MKSRLLIHLLPLIAISSAAADSFELKDGTKFEGSILREDGSDYIIQIQVTKSIRDERRVPKADVVSQVAELKDETAFEELAKLTPTADLLAKAAYDASIRKIEAFLNDYPKSTKTDEARKIIDILEEERAVIVDGGVKFGGKMISAAERAPQAYRLDANILASGIKSAAEAGDALGALRSWSKLEADFPGSTAYRETIPFMVRVMKSHLSNVKAILSGFDERTKSRASGLSTMNPNDRSRSENAIKEEESNYLARVAREKAEGVKWPSLNSYVKTPLEETMRMLDSDIRRMENLDPAQLRNTEEAYEEAYKAVTADGVTKQEIDAALSKARSANLPAPYVELLTKAAPTPVAP